ncbi:NADH dehydrogenase [ubiquinone] 1 beta subcomplex subunit 6, partial [Anas platyrhynchos]
QVFRAYQAGGFLVAQVLIPAWLVHYYVKYHVMRAPYGIVSSNPAIFPVSPRSAWVSLRLCE